MSSIASTNLPKWFWFAAGGALIWNILGVVSYLTYVTATPEAIASLPEAQQQIREATPAFVTAAYAIAVFGAALGSIFLLLRRSWAVSMFTASFVAVLAQFGYMFLALNVLSTGVASAVLPAMVIIIGLLLLRFSMSARRKGWLQ
ncbi:MAG: hypothetical protein AAF936_07675 [Pseudomonadota bacterium]